MTRRFSVAAMQEELRALRPGLRYSPWEEVGDLVNRELLVIADQLVDLHKIAAPDVEPYRSLLDRPTHADAQLMALVENASPGAVRRAFERAQRAQTEMIRADHQAVRRIGRKYAVRALFSSFSNPFGSLRRP